MIHNALITVCGTQTIDNESETIKNIHQGTYRTLPDMDVVLYEELLPDAAGNALPSTKNIMKIMDSRFILIKKGAIQTEMQFAQNQTFHGFYKTPMGVFDMTIHTHSLQIQKTLSYEKQEISDKTNEKCMDITIQYALSLNGMHVSDCTMKITVESAKA